jgi:HK97 family phage portal protein
MNINPVKWFTKSSSKHELKKAQNLIRKYENEFGVVLANKNHAGVAVNTKTALETDIVYTCIRDKSESIGQIPVIIRRNGVKLKKGAREHRIFTRKPNDYMSMQDLLEMYVTCMEMYGNFYIVPVKNKYNNIYELIPLRYQNNVRPSMDSNGRVYYTYSTNDGKPKIHFAGSDLIHIKLNSLDGFTGLSPLTAAARTLGIAISQEEHIASLMEKGARPSGVLTTDTIFKDPDALNRLKSQWHSTYAGNSNAGKTAVLEGGLKYQSMGLSPSDTELIKQRVFSRIQLCGIYRVPPARAGVVEAEKYKNLEENNKSYLKDSLMPLITKFETGINNELPDSLEIKIDVKQFARGDRKSQVEALGSELKLGSISIAEMREDLDREYIEGSDVFAIDTNNLTFGKLTDIPSLQEAALAAASNTNKPEPKEVDEDDE